MTPIFELLMMYRLKIFFQEELLLQYMLMHHSIYFLKLLQKDLHFKEILHEYSLIRII